MPLNETRQVMVATYSCGHSAQFTGAYPLVGDPTTCMHCLKEVVVTELHKEFVPRPPKVFWRNT